MKWKLVPVDPTPAMIDAAGMGWIVNPANLNKRLRIYAAMVDAAPPGPHDTMMVAEARSCQNWRGMDGATAFHLIDRHADGWGDACKMMSAWAEANRDDGKTPNV